MQVPAPLPPEGLYVHVPFCVSLCPYCDFVVYAGAAARGPRARIDAFLEALQRELELRAGDLDDRFGGRRRRLGSVYLGGGTPSLLSARQVGDLIERIDLLLGIEPGAEITLEANPGRGEVGDLPGLRAAGVSRLSIGAQSMQVDELRRLGRRHRPEDVIAAVSAARAAGLASVSLDLLTDVPGQTLATWRATLRAALDLGADHLSVYALALDDPDAEGITGPGGDHLPLRPGARAWRERARLEQSQEQAAGMERLTDELTSAAGLGRYEIANLARPGHESRHNLLYWRRRPHLALGPGAHDFDGARTRAWNTARLDAYVAALARRRLPPGGRDVVDASTARAEEIILGLRLHEGVDARRATEPAFAAALTWAGQGGLVEQVDGRIRLTALGRLLANEVFVRLLPDGSGTGRDLDGRPPGDHDDGDRPRPTRRPAASTAVA